MTQTQIIWTKKKILEMDVYVEHIGIRNMQDENWQTIVDMADRIVEKSDGNKEIRKAVLDNLEMWEIAWNEEKKASHSCEKAVKDSNRCIWCTYYNET